MSKSHSSSLLLLWSTTISRSCVLPLKILMLLLFFTVLNLQYKFVKLQLEYSWPEDEANDLYERVNTDHHPTPNLSSKLYCHEFYLPSPSSQLCISFVCWKPNFATLTTVFLSSLDAKTLLSLWHHKDVLTPL